MILLGLTGSIGMGKSTTAKMFRDEGVPVWDADEAVRRLYAEGGGGVEAIRKLAKEAIEDGRVNREALREAIVADTSLLAKIEAEIHPLVREDREEFRQKAEADGADIAVFDIPLLFETGAQEWLDTVVVVTAPPEVQHERVTARPGITEKVLEAIIAKQTPDSEKRRRADFLINTGKGFDHARDRVRQVLEAVRSGKMRDHLA